MGITCGRPEWEEGYYRVKKLVEHRVKYNGTKEYLVQWQGKNPKTGQLWADTWCVADDLTPDLVDAYEARYKAGIPSTIVQVDAAIAYNVMRRSLAHALAFGAPKASGFQGRNRPRVHKVLVGVATLQPVALAILELARTLGGPKIRLERGNKGKPDEWWQLQIKNLSRIASFCSFAEFLADNKALGNIRLTGTAKHSGDMLVVGQPVMLTVKSLAFSPGVVNMYLEFPTICFNGATGQPTYPHMASGMLKSESERAKLITHVRDMLPERHPLRRNGWAALPAAVEAIAVEMAVPEEPDEPDEPQAAEA